MLAHSISLSIADYENGSRSHRGFGHGTTRSADNLAREFTEPSVGWTAESRERVLRSVFTLPMNLSGTNPPLTPPSRRRAEAALWRAAKAERGTGKPVLFPSWYLLAPGQSREFRAT